MNTKNIFNLLLSLLNNQDVNTDKWNIVYKHNPAPLLALLCQKNTICCIEQIGNTLAFDDDGTIFDRLSGNLDKLKSIALDQDLDFNDCQLYAELSKNASDDKIKETVQAFIDAYCSAIN